MKNKKASVWFPVIVVVMTVFTLIFATVVIHRKAEDYREYIVGERQFSIINAYDEAEKHLLYIDQSAKFSSSQAVYEQAIKGGYYSPPNCSTYRGFTLWFNGSDECYPNQYIIRHNFENYINNYLNLYLNQNTLIDIPKDNYDFLITGETKIFGFATKNIQLNISANDEKETVVGAYSVKPSFKTETDFNLEIYDEIKEKAGQIVSKCKDELDVKDCVEGNIIIYNSIPNTEYEWSLDCEPETEKAFYELVYKFEECIKQENSGCICRSYPVSRFKEELEDYSIKITQKDESTVIELYKGKRFTGLKKTIKNKLNYFKNNDHNVKDYLPEFIIKKGDFNKFLDDFLEYKSEGAGQEIYLYIAKDTDNNIGFLLNPDTEPKTKSCFPEKLIVVDSNNYASQESLNLVSLIKGKKGSVINLIDVITTDDSLLYLYTDGTEEGKINARIGALNKVGREQGSIDLYIYLNANEENNKELLISYYPYSDSEEIADTLKSYLSKDPNLDKGSRVFPLESKYDFLIDKSSFLSPAVSLNYSFTRRDRPLLMNNILKSIKDYIPEEPEQTNFKLCVNTGKKLVIYDEIEDKAEEKDITVRFALTDLEGIEKPEEPEEEAEELEEEPEAEAKIEKFFIMEDYDEDCRKHAGYRYSVDGICESGKIGSLCRKNYECDKGKCVKINDVGFCGYETHENCGEFRTDGKDTCYCEDCGCTTYDTLEMIDETWFCNEVYDYIMPQMGSGAPALGYPWHCESGELIEKETDYLSYYGTRIDYRCE